MISSGDIIVHRRIRRRDYGESPQHPRIPRGLTDRRPWRTMGSMSANLPSAAQPVLADDAGRGCRAGWDAVDVVFVTGDAYVDHPSFAMALLGRVLEAEGFRVAILEPARLAFVRRLADLRPAAALLRRQRGQHGLDVEPLHGQPQGPQRRRL